jgi:hypothetical protein
MAAALGCCLEEGPFGDLLWVKAHRSSSLWWQARGSPVIDKEIALRL